MYKNIAIAYDGSEGSRLALEKGIELSKILPGSKLTVLYVNEEAQERTGYMDVGHASAPVTSANVDSSYAQFMPQGIGDDGYRPPPGGYSPCFGILEAYAQLYSTAARRQKRRSVCFGTGWPGHQDNYWVYR